MLSLFARRNSAIVAAAVALTVASSALAVDSSYISLTVQASTSSTGPWVNSLNVNSITADDALFYRISANLATAGTTNASAVGLTTADNFTTITSYPNNNNYGLSSVQMNLSSVGSTVVKFTSAATIDPVFGFDVGSGKSGGTFTAGGNTLSNIRAEQGSGPNSFWGAPGGTGFVIATGNFGISAVGGTSTLGLDFSGIVSQVATMRWFNAALGDNTTLGNVNYSLSSANYTASLALTPLISISNVTLVGSGPSGVAAGSGVWHNGGNNGLWGTNTAIGSNWTTGIPDAPNQDATFDNTVINTPGGLTVDLGVPRTVRQLFLSGDASHPYTIGTVATANTLTLSTTTTTAGITASGGGTNVINAPVIAASNATVSVAAGTSLKFAQNISGLGTVDVTNNGSLTLAGTSTTVNSISGTVGATPTNYSGTTTIGAGANVTVKNAILQDTLHVQAGATLTLDVVAANPSFTVANQFSGGHTPTTSILKTLDLSTDLSGNFTSTLNIKDNNLIVDWSSTPASNPYTTIVKALKSGYNNGAWNGTGIISSDAATNSLFAVGIWDNSQVAAAGLAPMTTFGGVAVPLDAILVKFTYFGDLNLDGKFNTNDAIPFGTNYDFGAASNWNWWQGDFTYDGKLTTNDAIAFGSNYDTSRVHLPEPASLGILAIGAMGLLLRKRRQA